MISKKLFTGIVFVICTFAYSQTYAQMTATIVWDEIKQIASENGFKISAIINQSAEGIDIEEFSLINKASENNEFERLEIELVDIALLERSDGWWSGPARRCWAWPSLMAAAGWLPERFRRSALPTSPVLSGARWRTGWP